jgi:hypothetical protein
MYGITDARTASGDSIIVGNCTGAPVIDSVTLWNSTRLVGGDRYVNLYVKATGTVNYNVKLPSGLTLTEIVNNSVYFTMDKPGNYKGSDVVLTVINDCGTTTGTFGDGILHVVHYGSPGSDMTIGNNTYQTWVIPNVGTLMTGFSKEGTPSYSSAPGDPSDTRFGYYYGNETASACPAPWQVLTLADATTIAQMHHSGSSDLADQLSMNFTLGAYNASGNPTQTGSYGYAYLQAGSRIRWGAVGSVWTIAESDGSYAFLVKCILK